MLRKFQLLCFYLGLFFVAHFASMPEVLGRGAGLMGDDDDDDIAGMAGAPTVPTAGTTAVPGAAPTAGGALGPTGAGGAAPADAAAQAAAMQQYLRMKQEVEAKAAAQTVPIEASSADEDLEDDELPFVVLPLRKGQSMDWYTLHKNEKNRLEATPVGKGVRRVEKEGNSIVLKNAFLAKNLYSASDRSHLRNLLDANDPEGFFNEIQRISTSTSSGPSGAYIEIAGSEVPDVPALNKQLEENKAVFVQAEDLKNKINFKKFDLAKAKVRLLHNITTYTMKEMMQKMERFKSERDLPTTSKDAILAADALFKNFKNLQGKCPSQLCTIDGTQPISNLAEQIFQINQLLQNENAKSFRDDLIRKSLMAQTCIVETFFKNCNMENQLKERVAEVRQKFNLGNNCQVLDLSTPGGAGAGGVMGQDYAQNNNSSYQEPPISPTTVPPANSMNNFMMAGMMSPMITPPLPQMGGGGGMFGFGFNPLLLGLLSPPMGIIGTASAGTFLGAGAGFIPTERFGF